MGPNPAKNAVTLRPITPADAEAAAALCGELGYPADPETVRRRIERMKSLPDHAVYVACLPAGTVVGWIDFGIVNHFQGEPYVEIGGLVVSNAERSAGVGARLVARAEQWARERGIARLVVRSQIARERAHRFYLRAGYDRTKTSAVFTKILG